MLSQRLHFNYVADLLDEIALEGLDGITIPTLFERLRFRPNFIIDVDSAQDFIWNLLVQLHEVVFYCLPQPREELTSNLLACATPADRRVLAAVEEKIYQNVPVADTSEWGSCVDYETRQNVTTEVTSLCLADFMSVWGSRVVVVASLKRRLTALGIANGGVSPDLEEIFHNRVDFLYLEKAGRSRSRGVACAGPGSLLAIGKDSKRIFYHVKRLFNLGLVDKYDDSSTSATGCRVILRRFRLFRMAEDETDNLIRLLSQELNKRPGKIMGYPEVRSLCPNIPAKRFNKILLTDRCRKVFAIVKNVPFLEIYPNANRDEFLKKSGENRTLKCLQLLETEPSVKEDTIDGELDEDNMVECDSTDREYFFNVPLYTQIYRAILGAGNRGLSNVEILKKINAANCPTRAVLKKLLKDKIIEYQFRQSGRTRTRMFVIGKKEMQAPVVQSVQKQLLENAESENLVEPEEDVTCAMDLETTLGLQVASNDPRKLQRMAIILRSIKAKRILQAHALMAIIREDEEKRNLKDKMDRRSLHRILAHLVSQNILKLLVRTTHGGPEVKFYTDPSFDPDEWNFETASTDREEDPAIYMTSIISETDLEVTAWLREPESDVISEIGFLNSNKVFAPKYLRLSVLHDLIFYLTRGYTGETDHSGENLTKLAMIYPPIEELRGELPPLYSDHISPYLFIPPLSPIHDRVPGWCTMGEIIMSTPFSLYSKMVKLKEASIELQDYLDHPVRCNYTLRSLPPRLRRGLLGHRQLSQVMQDLRRLCYMGILKFGHRSNKRNLFLESFYVNQRACILDTTPSRPGYFQVDPNIEYEQIPFVFNTKADVKAYWVKLFNICLETALGHKSEIDEQDKFPMREEKKAMLLATLQPISIPEAYELDIGALPGDRLGAGGIDSCLFSFLRSNWVGPPMLCKGGTPKKRKRLDMKIGPPPPLVPLMKKRRKMIRAAKPRKPTLDELDMKATKLMRTLRVQWSRDEDNVALIIKAAMNYLCPNSRQSARISWTDMRAALWRHVPSSTDKTQLAVRRRIQFLVNKLERAPLVASLTQVLRNTPEVGEHFDCSDIVGLIKPSAPAIKELKGTLRRVFHELVDYMVERFIDNGHIVNLQELILPDSIEQLSEIYDLSVPLGPKLSQRKIKEDSVRAVLLSSMTSANDKSSIATQLYEVYRRYDEVVLQGAIKKLHRQKVITLKRKMTPQSGPAKKYLPVRNSPYQISFGFCFLMNTKYRQSVYHDAYLELNRLSCTAPGQTVELNLSSCGPAAFVLASLGHADLTAATPEQFVVIDSQLMPPHISAKIMDQYNELSKKNDPENLTHFKRSSNAVTEEPPAKKQIINAEDDEETPMEVRASSSVKRQSDNTDTPDQSKGFRSARLALFTLREVATKELESQVSKNPVDLFVVSTSKVLCTVNASLNQLSPCDGKSVKKILSKIAGRSDVLRTVIDESATIQKICSSNPLLQLEDLIAVMSFIDDKESLGVSLQELISYCERDELLNAVRLLEEHNLLFRFGVDETRFVSKKHASAWAIKSLKITRLNREKLKPADMSQPGPSTSSSTIVEHSTPVEVIMRPWLRIDGSVNRRVLDRFLGTILGYVMLNPGIAVSAVTRQFHTGFSPVWTKELINVLVEIGCITRILMHCQKPSLFSNFTTRISDEYCGFKFDEEVLLEPKVDAIIKLGQFIGNKSYNKDILEIPTTKKSNQ